MRLEDQERNGWKDVRVEDQRPSPTQRKQDRLFLDLVKQHYVEKIKQYRPLEGKDEISWERYAYPYIRDSWDYFNGR